MMFASVQINPYGPARSPNPGTVLYAIPSAWHLALSPTVGAYIASMLRQGRNRLTAEELDVLWPIYRREHECAVAAGGK